MRRLDPIFRMKANMKTRFSQLVSGKRRSFSISGIINYDSQTLREHLEKQFKPGMTWENYGKWHVDHIKPLDLFDLTDPLQAQEAWKLENLQPLWASENCSKSNRF